VRNCQPSIIIHGCRMPCKIKRKVENLRMDANVYVRRLYAKLMMRPHRIINEEAKRRLVTTYISGLGGLVEQQVRFRMPSSLDEAVQVAITVNNSERTKQTDTKKSVQCEAGWRSPGICVFVSQLWEKRTLHRRL